MGSWSLKKTRQNNSLLVGISSRFGADNILLQLTWEEDRDTEGVLDWLYKAALHLRIYSVIKHLWCSPTSSRPSERGLLRHPCNTFFRLISKHCCRGCIIHQPCWKTAKPAGEITATATKTVLTLKQTLYISGRGNNSTTCSAHSTRSEEIKSLLVVCFWVLSNVWSGVCPLASGTACDCCKHTCTKGSKVGWSNSVESHSLFVLCLENRQAPALAQVPLLPLPKEMKSTSPGKINGYKRKTSFW